VLHVSLHFGIIEFTTDESFGVEDGVVRVLERRGVSSRLGVGLHRQATHHGDLVLCGITYQSLLIIECDIGWSGSVALVVGNYLNSDGRCDFLS
jgi:hypothetical protein